MIGARCSHAVNDVPRFAHAVMPFVPRVTKCSEAGKYTQNTRMMVIQAEMAQRCIELLALAEGEPKLILDVGCGSGLSGDELTDAGHGWVGLDISRSMLDVAVGREVEGDVIQSDMGQGFGFRAGCFDGAISVSALQWLCYSDKSGHRTTRRLTTFFSSLYRCLRRGARAALQVYPENSEQLEAMTTAALRCGFTGGLVVDFPNSTKAKKYFLCLFAGVDPDAARAAMPTARGGNVAADAPEVGDAETAAFEARRGQLQQRGRRDRSSTAQRRVGVKSRPWILKKKESQRRSGHEVRPDSKYTGRKRSSLVR